MNSWGTPQSMRALSEKLFPMFTLTILLQR